MFGLDDVCDTDGRWRTVVRATLLFAGCLVAGVGFVVAAASLVAGFGLGTAASLKVATFLGGTLVLVGVLLTFVRLSSATPSHTLAGLGILLGVAGLVLFWTTLPTDWTGNPAQLPPVALGTYAAGLLVAFGAELVGATDAKRDTSGSSGCGSDSAAADRISGIESVVGTDANGGQRERAPPSAVVGDGGEQADDLQFFDDES